MIHYQNFQECSRTCGTWSEWTEFTPCLGCGQSTQTLFRTCNGGVIGQPNCYGNNFESRGCNTRMQC